MTTEGVTRGHVARTDVTGASVKSSPAHLPVPFWGNLVYWACATIMGTNLNSKEES